VAWIDRSLVTPDQLVAMLFLFFALEAILGDKAEGLKSLGLAFRRSMLGHLARLFHDELIMVVWWMVWAESVAWAD